MKKADLQDRVVSGLFENVDEANRAVEAMAAADVEIAPEDISVITNKKDYEEEELEEIAGDPLHHESIHAAKIGGMIGFGLGIVTAVLGFWMGGSSISTLPLILIIGGTVGVLGALIQAGSKENEATSTDEAVREGKVFLTLRSHDRDKARRAENILRECHAHGVHHY